MKISQKTFLIIAAVCMLLIFLFSTYEVEMSFSIKPYENELGSLTLEDVQKLEGSATTLNSEDNLVHPRLEGAFLDHVMKSVGLKNNSMEQKDIILSSDPPLLHNSSSSTAADHAEGLAAFKLGGSGAGNATITLKEDNNTTSTTTTS